MDEKYIQALHSQLGGESVFGKYEDFKDLITSDPQYAKNFYNNFGQDVLGAEQDFYSLVKKKDIGVSTSKATSSVSSPKTPSAYNKGIESRDWQAHQALTRSLQEAAQKNDAVGVKNAQSQLEQLRASNPTIASDPLLNEDLQTANKFIKAAPVQQQPAVKFPTTDRLTKEEADKAIKGKAYVSESQLVEPGYLNLDEKVNEFNKEFGSLGVRFEKTDNPIASNFEGQITAIADNGEQMPVMIYRNEIAAKKEKEKLQEFLFRNSGGVNKKELTPTQFLSMAENGVSPEDENKFKRLYTKENVDKSLKFVNEQLQYSSNTMNDIKKEIDDINKEAEDIAAIVSTQGMTPELKAKADDIQLRYNEKSKEFENQKNHAKTVFSLADAGTKSLAAQNVKLLKEEGNIFGGLYNSLLNGSKSLASGAVYAALEGTDILTMGLTNDAQKTQYEKEANKWLNDKFKESKLSSTTSEYMTDPDHPFRSALFSVPEMFPAFTIPGGFVAGMTLQGIGRRMEEYDNNPEMKNVPKEEKFILSGLNSFVEAKLENVGITQTFSKAGLANSLLLKSMAKWAPKSGINGLNRILNTEINNLAIKGALNTAGAMIAEGETGALQSATEMASNELYNIAKEKELFKNPNTTKELLGKVWEDAEMEALGGMWMAGVVNIATNTAQYTLGKILDNQTFKLAKTIINDKATKASFVADLKTKIAKGEITKEKAQSLLTSFNEANAIVSQMPENISVENQRKAYDLIAEKRKLASQIEGKDPNLTAKPRERIKQIDVELTNISNATQEEEVNEPIQEEVKQKPVIKEESQVKINELADSLKNDIEFEKKNNKNKKNNKYIKVLEDELNLLTTNPEEYLKQKISELSKDAEFESSTNYYKNLLENLYAVQEQSTSEVSVQPETGVSQEVEQGVPESKPEVVTEQGEEVTPKEKIKVIVKDLDNAIKNSPIEFIKQPDGSSIITGGDNEIKNAAKSFDKKENVTSPSKIDFLPEEIFLTHLVRNEKDKKNILKNGFDEAKTSIDSPVPGIYFSSEDWSNVDRFGRKVEDSLSVGIKNDGLLYFDSAKDFSKYLKENNLPYRGETLSKEQVDFLKQKGIKGIVLREDFASQSKNELIVIDKSIINDISESNRETTKLPSSFSDTQSIAEAYQEAKNNNNNPDLIKAVDKLLKSRVQESKAPSIEEEGTRVPEQKAEGVRAEPTIEEEAKKKSAFDQVEGGVEAKQKSLDSFEKTRKRGQKTFAEARENAISTLKKTFAYERADDVQREEMERELRTELGEKLKKAPSVNKILGKIKDITKVTVNEAVALKEQIKLEVKASKDAVKYINGLRKSLAAEIKNIEKRGKINARQAGAIVNKLNNVNFENTLDVRRFVDYMTKVFKDAEYADKLDTASSLKSKILKKLKNSKNQISVVNVSKRFSEINPAMVENIDEYISEANKVLSSLVAKPSQGGIRSAADFVSTDTYVNNILKEQQKKEKQDKLEDYDFLVTAGVIDDSMSLDEINQIIEAIEDNNDEKKEYPEILRDYLESQADSLSSIAQKNIDTGIDPLTNTIIDLTRNQKIIIKKLIGVAENFKSMTLPDIKQTVEYLQNFIANGITDGVEGFVEKQIGAEAAEKLHDKFSKTRRIKRYFSNTLGEIQAKGLSYLHPLIESMFHGQSGDRYFSNSSGIYRVEKGVNQANSYIEKKTKEYLKEFGNKDFFDVENIYERGILSLLFRNDGSENYFENQKSLIQQSIDEMLSSTKDSNEIKKGKIAQKVFDKLIKDANNGQEVFNNAKEENRRAVLWWVNIWDNNYPALEEVSRNVYNDNLTKEENYTSKVYKKVDPSVTDDVDLLNNLSAYRVSTGDYTVKSKSGVLIKTTRNSKLPKNRILNFDFDINQMRVLKAALIDTKTAGPIRQVEGFINSPSFMKLGPKEDMQLLKGRINRWIALERGKDFIEKDELHKVAEFINKLNSLGAARALFSLAQIPSQTIPVAYNTLINSGGKVAFLNKDMQDFIDNSGSAVANRGSESVGLSLSSVNKLIEEASKSTPEKFLKKLNSINQYGLKKTLANPDRSVARSSFISYYAQKIGKNIYEIDWKEEAKNPKEYAINYADQMVNRQQTASNPNQAGNWFTSKDSRAQIFKSLMLPLATFSMNQKIRMQNDLVVLFNKMSSPEDKSLAARSLFGLVNEMSSYLTIRAAIGYALTYASVSIMFSNGDDEDDKEKQKILKKKTDNIIKNSITSASTDLLAPMPLFNTAVVDLINIGLDQYYGMKNEGKEELTDKQKEKREKDIKWYKDRGLAIPESYKTPIAEEAFQLFSAENIDQTALMGAGGIAISKIEQAAEYEYAATTGKIIDKTYGKTRIKYLLPQDQEVLKQWAVVPALYNLGLLPAEFNNIANNLMKIARGRAITEKEKQKQEADAKWYRDNGMIPPKD